VAPLRRVMAEVFRSLAFKKAAARSLGTSTYDSWISLTAIDAILCLRVVGLGGIVRVPGTS